MGAFLHAMHDSGGGPDSKDDLQGCWAAAGLSSMVFEDDNACATTAERAWMELRDLQI